MSDNTKLKSLLYLEKLKNKILSSIIEKKLSLGLSTLLKVNESGMYISSQLIQHSDLIPVFLKNYYNNNEQEEFIEEKKNEGEWSWYFEKLSENIKAMKKSELKSLKKIKSDLNELLNKNIGYDDYKKILLETSERIKVVLVAKKYNDIKIKRTLSKIMTYLDLRIIRHPEYTNTPLTAEDLRNTLSLLRYNKLDLPFQTVFNNNYESISNYSLAILDLKKILKTLITGNQYNTIVYHSLKNNKDPYNFYKIEKIQEGKRFWIMDCRLENTANEMSNHLKQQGVQLFRSMYYDVFKTNVYQKNYKTHAEILAHDAQQLLKNIILATRTSNLRAFLIDLIYTHNNYSGREEKRDYFNLTGDDRLQKKRLARDQQEESRVIETVLSLFDGEITEENAVSLIKELDSS